ncbi:MAG: hypothetical protein A3E02_02435 [Candidatus Zambryskibacteria bacterium RIFCSPHIGHO2_12_FULL_38_34]|nr:MAG: hypothetical protein A3E02_02435 [Candidatus Zambryskibacteria bacterium RIFCSPHIGHO2_12_FULL_38_34]
MIYQKIKTESGFVALMSAIILSVILLLVTTSLSFSGFSSRLDILNSEYKERSSSLAEACVDAAILKLAASPTYSGGPPDVDVGTDKCTIEVFNPSSDPIIIKTKGTFQNAVTNLRITIDKTSLAILSWEELPNF